MTALRKKQLDDVAERFGCNPICIYMLAGELPNVIEYVPSNETRSRKETTAHHSRTNTRNMLKSMDFSLDWAESQ